MYSRCRMSRRCLCAATSDKCTRSAKRCTMVEAHLRIFHPSWEGSIEAQWISHCRSRQGRSSIIQSNSKTTWAETSTRETSRSRPPKSDTRTMRKHPNSCKCKTISLDFKIKFEVWRTSLIQAQRGSGSNQIVALKRIEYLKIKTNLKSNNHKIQQLKIKTWKSKKSQRYNYKASFNTKERSLSAAAIKCRREHWQIPRVDFQICKILWFMKIVRCRILVA